MYAGTRELLTLTPFETSTRVYISLTCELKPFRYASATLPATDNKATPRKSRYRSLDDINQRKRRSSVTKHLATKVLMHDRVPELIQSHNLARHFKQLSNREGVQDVGCAVHLSSGQLH